MKYPTAEEIVAAAEKLYEEIRDVSKHEATYVLANALIAARSAGATEVFDDLAARKPLAPEPVKP